MRPPSTERFWHQACPSAGALLPYLRAPRFSISVCGPCLPLCANSGTQHPSCAQLLGDSRLIAMRKPKGVSAPWSLATADSGCLCPLPWRRSGLKPTAISPPPATPRPLQTSPALYSLPCTCGLRAARPLCQDPPAAQPGPRGALRRQEERLQYHVAAAHLRCPSLITLCFPASMRSPV
eukprot:6201757-Pleurochrysis_carterae.AAC.3